MKPIILKQVGTKWEVYVDMAAAHRRALRVTPMMKKYPPDALLRVVKHNGGFKLSETETPAKFTKKDADHFAHKIGYYGLDIGSFVYTYTEERRESRSKAERDAKHARRSRVQNRRGRSTRRAR